MPSLLPTTDQELLQESPSWLSRMRRWTVLYAFTPYCAVLILLGLFQRSLLYHPTQAAGIHPDDAGLMTGQVHAVSTTTEDGLTLNGWHVLANGATAASREECDAHLERGGRVVLYFAGNALNRSYRGHGCGDFTSLDADVFIFDYRGYGDNPGSPSEQGLAADARAVWNYVTKERKVAPERIVLFGQSLGGGVATRLCSEVCEAETLPAGLVLSSTFSSISDTAAWHYPIFPVRLLLQDRFPSAERIRSVNCPVLQIHGAQDLLVPIELGRKLHKATPEKSATGISKQFVELPQAGHNDIPSHRFRDSVGEFLRMLSLP